VRPASGIGLALGALAIGVGATGAAPVTDAAVTQVLRLESFVLDDGRLKVELFVAPDVPAGALALELPGGRVPLGACAGGGRTCQGGRGRLRRARRRGVHGRRVTLVASLPAAAKLARAVVPGRSVLVTMHAGGRVGTASVVATCAERGRRFQCRAAPPPHVLVVITDDQRADTLDVMPAVERELVARGASFPEAFTTTPVCCPSRASILSGLYAHNHGTRTLSPPDGGATAFVGADRSTIATWLAAAGYRTGHFGKYLNGYHRLGPPERAQWYVPPGWQRWLAFRVPGYFGYDLVDEQARLVSHGGEPGDYSTDVLAAAARAWIGQALDAGRPVLVHFAPFAPHVISATGPFAKPAPRHAELEFERDAWNPPAWDEPDVGDKPAWVRAVVPMTPFREVILRGSRVSALRALKAVDEAVASMLALLRERDAERDALVVYTSDNGLTWGEHRLFLAKLCPYDECIRVPLVLRYPPLVPEGARLPMLVENVDLAPTLAALAGVLRPTLVDGRDLVPLFGTTAPAWRDDVLLEGWALRPRDENGFIGVRTQRWKLVRYTTTGELELYDLEHDPHELESLAADPAHAERRAELERRAAALAAAKPER
jgi:arylsulfatase A-like enzyme